MIGIYSEDLDQWWCDNLAYFVDDEDLITKYKDFASAQRVLSHIKHTYGQSSVQGAELKELPEHFPTLQERNLAEEGFVITCESPLEILHSESGSIATGRCAKFILENL